MKWIIAGLLGYAAYKYTDGFKYFLEPKTPAVLPPPTTPDIVGGVIIPQGEQFFSAGPLQADPNRSILTAKTAPHLTTLAGLDGNAGIGLI